MSIQAFTSNNKGNWKANLPVLWLGVFLCCASYTMCIPFLPVYLLRELHEAAVDLVLGLDIAAVVQLLHRTAAHLRHHLLGVEHGVVLELGEAAAIGLE